METVIVLALLAAFPAVIAFSKGRSFGLWYIYGLALFPVAALHALLVEVCVTGMAVESVESDVARAAGLAVGDVIIAINERATHGQAHVQQAVSTRRSLSLEVLRGGHFITVSPYSFQPVTSERPWSVGSFLPLC